MTRTRLVSARQAATTLLLLALAETTSANVDTAWVRWYDGPYHGLDFGSALALDHQGNVVVACKITSSARNFDIAVLKYSRTGELLWASHYAGPAGFGDWPRALTVDEVGNIYVVGAGESLAYDTDMLTLKYSPEGELEWSVWHGRPNGIWEGDEATAVAVDDSGCVYVAGWEAYLGPRRRYVTIKYDSAGNEQWVATCEGPGFDDQAWAIAVDPGGNVFVTGRSARETTGNYMATVCYDNDGNEKWVTRVSGGHGTTIALDGAGGVYVGGSSGGNTSPLTIVRYDSTGNQRWIARYVGPAGLGGTIEALAADGRGHVFGTGIVSLQYPDADFATLKLDSAGSVHWIRLWGGAAGGTNRPYAIALDSAGNAYVTGISFTGPGIYVYECATVKYNPQGDEQWVARYTTGFSGGGFGKDVAVGELGHLYVTGSMAIDSLRLTDAFIIKYVEIPGGIVGPGAALSCERLPPTLIRGTLTLGLTSGRAELLDLSGRVVTLLSPGPNDVRHLAPGIYFCRLEAGNAARTVRLILLR